MFLSEVTTEPFSSIFGFIRFGYPVSNTVYSTFKTEMEGGGRGLSILIP